MDGAVVALVYVDRGSNTPLPTTPGLYKTAKAPVNFEGDCVRVGASRALTQQGSVVALAGQPSWNGSGLPTTPICQTASANTTFVFGPFTAGQCGTYAFSTDLSADLTNSPKFENAQLSFGLKVEGCP